MKNRYLTLALIAVAAFCNADGWAAQPDYAYSTTVQLSNGKTVRCAVNEPASVLQGANMTLSIREQTEADVLATQPLRLLSGPSSDYPTPYTAPNVTCGAVG
jgi:hypothetical protein